MDDVRWKIPGKVRLWVTDDVGTVLEHYKFENLVTTISRRSVGNLLRGDQYSSPVRAIAIGDSAVAATLDDTALGNERFRQSIPAAGTDTPVQKNLISEAPGPVVITFAQWITPFVANSGVVAGGGVGSSFNVAEFGLFTDIVPMADPGSLATLAVHSPASGTVPSGDYTVKYSWVNDNGETLPSSASATLTVASQGGFDITLPAAPSAAKQTRIYIKTNAGDYYLHATVSAATTVYSVDTQPPTSASPQPSGVNTSLVPGKTNSGTLFNHAILPVPVTLVDPMRIMIESSLTLG